MKGIYPKAENLNKDLEFLKQSIKYMPKHNSISWNYARIVGSITHLIFGTPDSIVKS